MSKLVKMSLPKLKLAAQIFCLGFLGLYCFSLQRYFGISIISSSQARAKKVLKNKFQTYLVAREVSPFPGVVTSSCNPYNSAIQTEFVPFFSPKTLFSILALPRFLLYLIGKISKSITNLPPTTKTILQKLV